MCNSARMKVISLFAFYMLMSQGSGASLNGLNQMDKKHEAEELEDQLHLEKRKVKTSSEREMNPEVTTTMEVTTAMDLPLTTELNEENILETLGVNGFVHLVSSVFEHHPQVLKEFLSRKSNLLVKHSSMNGRPTHHHIRPHLPETANSGSYLPAHYKKSNLLNHGPLRRHYNPTEKRHQNHIYQGSFFHSLEKGLAGHRQPDTFGQTLKQSKRTKKLALPEKRNDVRKLRVSERTSGSSSGGSGGGSSSVYNKYESNTASHFMDSKSKQDKVNTDRSSVEAPVKTITEEANDDHENVEVSTAQQPVDNDPRAPDFNENSVVAEDDSKEDNENFQYETDLQRTSFGEKNFSNGFPVLPIKKEKPVRVAQRPDLSGTQDEKHIISIKHELQDDDQLADTQLDSERNTSVKIIKIHKPIGTSPPNTEKDREDRDWVGVGHAKQVVTSASKTVSGKSSKEIPSPVTGQNIKESHKRGKEVGLPLQLPIYSHRRLVPRRTNRTKEILSSKNISLQSAAKNTANMEDKVHRTRQQMFKERRLISHRRKPVMNIPKTEAAETVTQMASKDQDSNNDEKALMSLVSHLNTNSKQHKQ